MADGNGNGRVTLAKVYELLSPLDARIRRLEIMVGILTVATLSPKLGGPAPSQIVSTVIALL